ncbi:enoyl-CoA hydratase/isomerase family protein [Dactylosporangium sp. AC04546]|uniref:enoyl-CoA hydratase/isomerase family protein n=1 Tax=Dactylosporangium sp. AC04546 TaxID=2862460 RepID=UPI001EDE4835|nr:enoyl-CoA hydratase/isomerase family protein [Dactylosporangium sp. AC04546]WVK86828.1 enoyl-CoA hydratase/isomerase family protein [Dactylosporangium sp. AC04546]
MSPLDVVRDGPVAILTLDRPRSLNALTTELMDRIADALGELGRDTSVGAAVITGRGDKAFCAGADLKEMSRGGLDPLAAAPDIGGISTARFPVLAAVNGVAYGGGLELALCCDLRFAATTATFAAPEVRHGLIPGLAATRLPRLVPHAVAMDLLLGGRPWTAEQAQRVGLVQDVHAPEDLLGATVARAHDIAGLPRAGVQGVLDVGRWWRDHAIDGHQLAYQTAARRVLATGDYLERSKAFADGHERRTASPTSTSRRRPAGPCR